MDNEDSRAFLETILSNADELDLDASQIAELNKLYWSIAAGSPKLTKDISRSLDDDQFDRAALMFSRSAAASHSDEKPLKATIEGAVREELNRRLKDASVVTSEVAAALGEKLIGWGKIFVSLIAAPLAILLIILALMGYSKLEDLRNASDNVDKAIAEAQSKVVKAAKDANSRVEKASQEAESTARKMQETTATAKKKLAAAQTDIDQTLVQVENAKLKFASLNTQAEAVLAEAEKRTKGLKGELDRLKETDIKNQNEISSLKTKVQQLIGDLAAQKESNNAPAGAIFEVRGEKLYGPWGIGARYLKALMDGSSFAFKDKFKSLQPGSPKFDEVWASIGKSDPDKFREAQRQFIYDSLYLPFVRKVKRDDGVDITQRSRTLQEVVLRVCNHAGYDLPFAAIQDMKKEGKWKASDPGFNEFFIRALYGRLIAQSKPRNLASYQQELNEELVKLAAEPKSGP